MDAFQQNWTERIKQQPFVNYVLNTEDPHTIEWRGKRVQPRTGRLRERYPSRPYNRIRLANVRNRYGPGVKKDDMIVGQEYTDRITLIYKTAPTLQSNTRPNSLYNLKYASLR